MFKDYGGTIKHIQGLDCHIPPVGKVFNLFTNELEERKIYSRSDKKTEQYWERPPKPKNIARRLIEEKRNRENIEGYFESDLQLYREKEWDRRMNGFWFYNNGIPTYITGLHYFYLTHWRIDVGYPKFRTTDMEYFYFLKYVEEDPDCFGMVEVTQRRNGKSFRAGCWIYEVTSRVKRKRAGIQSKDLEAGETFFDVHVVQPYVDLEQIFKPEVDLEKGLAPKKKLRFFATQSRGIAGSRRQEDKQTKQLRSVIDFQASTEKAYDGKKLVAYVRDECGKTEEANVYVCHGVIKPCLSDGAKIIGKALYTTTVEDIKDDDLYHTDGNFKRLFEESDQTKKGLNNRTISGLYRYFLPAYRADNFDRYGIPDEEKTKQFQLNERANLTGHALAAYIRKYPFTVEEAFWTSKEKGLLNPIPIENQRAALSTLNKPDYLTIGNLHWKDGKIGSKVVFTETPNGRFSFLKKFDIKAECELKNSDRDHNGNFYPLMKGFRVIGVDPVDHKYVDGEGSKAAAYLYIKFDADNDLSETFVCEYINRPDDPEIFYADMGLLAFATGAILWVENQKPGIFGYLDRVGLRKMYHHTGATPGIPSSPKTQRTMGDQWEIYIEHNTQKIAFENLLRDLSGFNLIKTTKFDAAMAAGWALVGAYGERVQRQNQQEEEQTSAGLSINELLLI